MMFFFARNTLREVSKTRKKTCKKWHYSTEHDFRVSEIRLFLHRIRPFFASFFFCESPLIIKNMNDYLSLWHSTYVAKWSSEKMKIVN